MIHFFCIPNNDPFFLYAQYTNYRLSVGSNGQVGLPLGASLSLVAETKLTS
jgi:hypothetical protein